MLKERDLRLTLILKLRLPRSQSVPGILPILQCLAFRPLLLSLELIELESCCHQMMVLINYEILEIIICGNTAFSDILYDSGYSSSSLVNMTR